MFEFLFKLNVFVSVCNIVLFIAFVVHTISQFTEEELTMMSMSPNKQKKDIAFYVKGFAVFLICTIPIINFATMYLLSFGFNDLVDETAKKLRKELLNESL